MKNHPIDDLFKDKLFGLEKQPSSRAWERIQAGQKKNEHRIGAWIWYAAAGVLLALGTGYSVWFNDSENVTPDVAVIVKPKSIPASTEKRQPETFRIEEKQFAVSEKPDEKEANVTKAKHVVQVVNIKTTAEKIEKVEKSVLSQEQVAVTKPDVREPEAALANQITPVQTTGITQNQPVAVAVEKVENLTIVVKIDEPDENQDKRKPSRFSKIFRQLKNVKEGESVNWEDVGFNPKSLVARVDDRLKHGEEKVSEKYQDLKERTKL